MALVVYFALACVGMWFFLCLVRRNVPESMTSVAEFAAAWTPNVSAALVIAFVAGRDGLKSWLDGWAKWRVGFVWYLVAFSPIAIAFAVTGVNALLGGSFKRSPHFFSPAFGQMVIYLLLMGATGEEGGWRGFAQPKLQAHLHPTAAALIVGLLWAVWHLPAYFGPGMINHDIAFGELTILLMAHSVIMAWAFNATKGSILIAVLYHFSQNIAFSVVGCVVHVRPTGKCMAWLPTTVYVVYSLLVAVACRGLKSRH